MRITLLFIFCVLSSLDVFAQAQKSSFLLNWQLNEKLHQLDISDIPSRLPKTVKELKISYQEDHSNSKDFFTLQKDKFYTSRQNAFKINKKRYSGKLLGYDKAGDLRFEIEFRKGKLDGNYIQYHTDGRKSTKVYSNGKLIGDEIIIKESY